MEDRSDMVNPIVLGESKTNFIVGFFNEVYAPVEVDPRYGRLELYQHK